MCPPSLPTAAVTIVEGPTGQKREASKKRLPLFRRDELKHRTANAQARERSNNAGRVTVQLSAANRALYPTRVHYIVIAIEAPSRLILLGGSNLRSEQLQRTRAAG